MAESFFKNLGKEINSLKMHGTAASKVPKTPDDEYQAALAGFIKIRNNVADLADSAESYVKRLEDFAHSVEKIAERFDRTLSADEADSEADDADAPAPDVDATAGSLVSANFNTHTQKAVCGWFREHVLTHLRAKVVALAAAGERIARRQYVKEEYDYYVNRLAKVQAKDDPKPEHKEKKVAQAQPAVDATKKELDALTAPLMEFFAACSALRPHIVAREYEQFKRCQQLLLTHGHEQFNTLAEPSNFELTELPPVPRKEVSEGMQRVPTVVPKGIRAGQAFEVKVDGHSHKAMCPAYAHEGDTILVDVPITPAREAGASVDGDDTHKPANQAQDRSLTEASSANAEDAETKQADEPAAGGAAPESSVSVKQFFERTVSDISDGFNALAKHNINALAMGKVEKTPDEPFEVAERETTGLRLSVAALSKNASSFVANLTALTQSVESMATGFVAAGLEEAVDALTASETITGEIQAKAVEGLNANVVAHLRNKTEAPAGLNLLKRRRELKIEFDYYHQKMRHLEDKKDLKAEAKEKKLAQNKPKLDEARAKLQLATTQLMGFFGECHEIHPRLVAHEYEQFKANQQAFFEAAKAAFEKVPNRDVPEQVLLPQLQDLAGDEPDHEGGSAEEKQDDDSTASAAVATTDAATADGAATEDNTAVEDGAAAVDDGAATEDGAAAEDGSAASGTADTDDATTAQQAPPIPPRRQASVQDVKDFFVDAGNKIEGAFESLKKHKMNALAVGRVPPTPDDAFATAAASFFALKAEVNGLVSKAKDLLARMETFTSAIYTIMKEFAGALTIEGEEPTVDVAAGLEAASNFVSHVQEHCIAAFRNNVLRALESKRDAINAIDLHLGERRKAKAEYDYYAQKLQKLQEQKTEGKEMSSSSKAKLERNSAKLKDAQLALRAVSAPLMALFGKCKNLGSTILAFESDQFQDVQTKFFAAGDKHLRVLAASSEAELLPMPALQDDVDIVLNTLEADLAAQAPAPTSDSTSGTTEADAEQDPGVPQAAESEDSTSDGGKLASLPVSNQESANSGPATPRFPTTPKESAKAAE
eukprot:INCI1074.4.p1 GENE.INCI1074.4~~INCI1074.4.p1  ORF type:complete len:1056 (+),score=282.35 INCI1074.4:190-3357(+)